MSDRDKKLLEEALRDPLISKYFGPVPETNAMSADAEAIEIKVKPLPKRTELTPEQAQAVEYLITNWDKCGGYPAMVRLVVKKHGEALAWRGYADELEQFLRDGWNHGLACGRWEPFGEVGSTWHLDSDDECRCEMREILAKRPKEG